MSDESIAEAPLRRPTIADVARRAKTSRGTVSFVINDRPGVAPATRQRVLDAMKELGWRPNQLARSLSTQRAYAIGFILARDPRALSSDPFFAPFIAGMESRLDEVGQFLMLRFVADTDSERAAYADLATQRRVDGFVLSDLREDDPRIELLSSLQTNAVTLNVTDKTTTFPAVSRSDEPGVADAVNHLVTLGHTKIAYVSGPGRYLHAIRRRATWQSALAAHGISAGHSIQSDFTAAGGSSATAALLDLPADERPTAIVYANDLMAAAGMSYAISKGVRVPDELSIVGYDDFELSAYLSPSLTTVRTDPMAWGVAAVDQLLRIIDGRETTNIALPPPVLVERGSTGPAPRP
ncbi:LacI family DNA-binding transcriptional regulator [Rarobacter faecitabidus]|uniref:LacI family transcriptional regulator n=1 Tax=Rarobacter faecitabidus TaxID=13243 RepID=A0A542ZB35_RARFA|nr:LacI family DNA-binding transcriptional regulator [Rarobacter faecitabidus]TQL57526.1 LacI family transcriptional regulator [Rarobacter faecitabidus]